MNPVVAFPRTTRERRNPDDDDDDDDDAALARTPPLAAHPARRVLASLEEAPRPSPAMRDVERGDGGCRRWKVPLACGLLGAVLVVALVVSVKSAETPRDDDPPTPPSEPSPYAVVAYASNRAREPADPDLADAARALWGDRPVLFAATGNYEPFEYVTARGDVDGDGAPLPPDRHTGFAVDLALAACEVCDLDCDFVLADTQDCWTSAGFPGVGLTANHFDACLGYADTSRRRLGVDFTDAIVRPRPAGILTRLDRSTGAPIVSPGSNLSDVVVAVVGGWATTGRSVGDAVNSCTGERFNASPIDGYIVLTADDPYGGPDAAMEALLSGAADAVFVYQSVVDDRKGCRQTGCNASLYEGLGAEYAWIHTDMYDYQLNGTTLAMTKKGNPLRDAIDPCLRRAMRSETYRNLCEEYRRRGFDDVGCLVANEDAEETKKDKDEDEDEDEDDAEEAEAPGPSQVTRGWESCRSGRCACDAR